FRIGAQLALHLSGNQRYFAPKARLMQAALTRVLPSLDPDFWIPDQRSALPPLSGMTVGERHA
ncbi:MAG: hypothetical protein AAFY24_13115, partial [Pseudomonadota bacterium]